MTGSSAYRRIYAVVREIPRGRVSSYGQIALMAGLPGRARQVGYALSTAPDERGLPWHRVISARGMISPRADSMDEGRQRAMLEAEGIVFDDRGRVDLARFGWPA